MLRCCAPGRLTILLGDNSIFSGNQVGKREPQFPAIGNGNGNGNLGGNGDGNLIGSGNTFGKRQLNGNLGVCIVSLQIQRSC